MNKLLSWLNKPQPPRAAVVTVAISAIVTMAVCAAILAALGAW